MRSPAGSRSPVPPSPDHPTGPRFALAAVALAGLLTVAACGSPAATTSGGSVTDLPSATPTATATPSPSATATPSTRFPERATAEAPRPGAAAPTRPAEPTGLPWPASTAAGVASLQKEVDAGGQPWLLDPGEVAASYAAFRGWRDTRVDGTGSRRTVTSSAGTHVLTFAQPARKGDGGVWTVIADTTS